MRSFGLSEMHVRRLAYSDLPAVLAIERRAFETPWSLAMFVLELSKPMGICLTVTDREGMVGYLVCSRYADVWHLMNIAVTPRAPPRGHCAPPPGASLRGGRRGRPVHPRGAHLQPRARSRCTSSFGFRRAGHRRRYYHDNGEDALIMWLESPQAAVRA